MCEEIYFKGLSDERDDIRQLSAKVCFQLATRKIIFYSAETKLVKMAEKDHVLKVRANAMFALARYKSRLAVPVLIKVMSNEDAPDLAFKAAFRSLKVITGNPFPDKKAATQWWENEGKALYKDAKPLQRRTTSQRPLGRRAGDGKDVVKKRKPLPKDDGNEPLRGVPVGK